METLYRIKGIITMQMANPYILIADDDPEDRQALFDELARQNPGVTVKHVGGGRELLHFLNECTIYQLPALLVLDYQMPDLSGPQVLQQLSVDDRYSQIVKVMWSTSRRMKDMEECRRLGASHYIVKPDTIAEMEKATRQLTAIFEMAARPTL